MIDCVSFLGDPLKFYHLVLINFYFIEKEIH